MEEIDETKDYCTWFPETWLGVSIKHCCAQHDYNCSTSEFFKCLTTALGSKFHASYITFGGLVGCIFKFPSKMWKRWF